MEPTRAPRFDRLRFAAAGMVVFGLLEPKCLAGPKGQLPPLLMKVWLDNVAENGSIVDDFLHRDFTQSFGLIVYYLLALGAQIQLLRKSRAPADLFLLGALVAFVALASWQYKYTSYASFLAVAPAAIVISRLGGIGGDQRCNHPCCGDRLPQSNRAFHGFRSRRQRRR